MILSRIKWRQETCYCRHQHNNSIRRRATYSSSRVIPKDILGVDWARIHISDRKPDTSFCGPTVVWSAAAARMAAQPISDGRYPARGLAHAGDRHAWTRLVCCELTHSGLLCPIVDGWCAAFWPGAIYTLYSKMGGSGWSVSIRSASESNPEEGQDLW